MRQFSRRSRGITGVFFAMALSLLGSCEAPLRPDGIDHVLSTQGYSSLRSRRLADVSQVLGRSPTDASAPDTSGVTFVDAFQPVGTLKVNLPDDVQTLWEPGVEKTAQMQDWQQALSVGLRNALLSAEVEVKRTQGEAFEVNNLSYLTLRPEWCWRAHSQRPEQDKVLDQKDVVVAISRSAGFTLVRSYESQNIALDVQNFLAEKLKAMPSVKLSVQNSRLTIQDQTQPLLLGVRVQRLGEVIQPRIPVAKDNFEVLNAYLTTGIYLPPDSELFCSSVKAVAESATTVTLERISGAYLEQAAQRSARPVGFPVRMDLISNGRMKYPKAFTNAVLQEISPSEVAFCQVSFKDCQEVSPGPDALRVDVVRNNLQDDTRVVAAAFVSKEYEIDAEFYDPKEAAKLESSLTSQGAKVTRAFGSLTARVRRNDDLVIGLRAKPWREGFIPDQASTVGLGQLWGGGGTPQQVVFLRSGSGGAGSTTPYLEIRPGALSVSTTGTGGGQITTLISRGRKLADMAILTRLFGDSGLEGIDTAEVEITKETRVTANADKVARQDPRGVWTDTSSERLITGAVAWDQVNLRVQAVGADQARKIAGRLKSRFAEADVDVTGSVVSAKNIAPAGDKAIIFVTDGPLDSFKAPRPAPLPTRAGSCLIRGDRYIELGMSGFGISVGLAPGYSLQWYGPIGSELNGTVQVQVRLLQRGAPYGSAALATLQSGYRTRLDFDVGDSETLEVTLGAARISTTQGELECDIEWRLVGKLK